MSPVWTVDHSEKDEEDKVDSNETRDDDEYGEEDDSIRGGVWGPKNSLRGLHPFAAVRPTPLFLGACLGRQLATWETMPWANSKFLKISFSHFLRAANVLTDERANEWWIEAPF
ncbi:hypothetical protein AMTR_s00068p00027240 [Amborella trichopoda]|uniref:Uncharacterized protein n=1 Tax=Amborella trichopoda TaxID=13333 RepID=U5D434_AMBTC|nr:hypothetical protein AMTR_s00068p00027240 [Amborella trichopoda]